MPGKGNGAAGAAAGRPGRTSRSATNAGLANVGKSPAGASASGWIDPSASSANVSALSGVSVNSTLDENT